MWETVGVICAESRGFWEGMVVVWNGIRWCTSEEGTKKMAVLVVLQKPSLSNAPPLPSLFARHCEAQKISSLYYTLTTACVQKNETEHAPLLLKTLLVLSAKNTGRKTKIADSSAQHRITETHHSLLPHSCDLLILIAQQTPNFPTMGAHHPRSCQPRPSYPSRRSNRRPYSPRAQPQ